MPFDDGFIGQIAGGNNTGKVHSKNYLNVGGTIEGHVSIKLGGTSAKK